jgi:signal transduction histidine kinase/ligand-binding sensor domain-containing protein
VSALAIGVMAALVGVAGRAAEARPGHLTFRGYGPDDGLDALDVYVGLQDDDGFIWAASPNGLFRFDGHQFERFGPEHGLPSSLVTDMAVAPDGTLWGASSRGLFRHRRDAFVALGTDVLPADGMHLLAFDGDGRTWVTTTRGPYLATGDRVEPVADWPGGEAFAILAEPDGAILIGRGARLLRRAPGTAGFEDVGHDFREPITFLVRDGRGRLWARAGQHLWMQRDAGGRFEDRSELAGAIVGPAHARLGVGATGALLVPTASGLVEIDGDTPRLLATDLPEEARSVKSVWVDREGTLWLTSLGLYRQTGRGLWRTISAADGLPSSDVWAVRGLADGRVAVGTERGAALIDERGIVTITDRRVAGLAEAPAGVLWMASSSLLRYDLASGALRDVGAETTMDEGAPTALAATADGTLWVGTDRGGVYRITSASPTAIEHLALPGADGTRVWALATDAHGLWATTSRGLFLLDDGGWRRFTRADGLRDDGLTFLTIRRSGALCVSYLSAPGATCARYQDGQLVELEQLDDGRVGSPIPYSLGEDRGGRLWIGGARGVTVIGGGVTDHFTRRGGAPGDDCNASALWVAPGGEVWLGTSTGLGVFDERRYAPPPPPTVTLERGHLGARALIVDDWRLASAPTVPYRDGHLDVSVAAISFLDPGQLEYQVRLIGFDDDWRASAGRDARYHRLPAGSYQFAARARYRGGAWGEPTTFAFTVATPWWGTWWFRAALALGIVGALVALVRWRSRALVRRNLELETTVGDRTRELVQANERLVQAEKLSAVGRLLAQLSHEINNPLNVIQNNLGPLEEYAQTMGRALTACRAAAVDPATRAAIERLWRQHDLDFVVDDCGPAFELTREAIARINSINSELRMFLRGEPPDRELVDLGASLRATMAMLAPTLPDVELRCELPPLPPLHAHEVRINQTITNLLQNAADAMQRRGRITLDAIVDDERVRLRVTDTGPGVAPELVARIFEPFFTTKDVGQGLGLGLAISREIIQAHGGTLEIDRDHAGGARFIVSLPRPAGRPAIPVPPTGVPTGGPTTTPAATITRWVRWTPLPTRPAASLPLPRTSTASAASLEPKDLP